MNIRPILWNIRPIYRTDVPWNIRPPTCALYRHTVGRMFPMFGAGCRTDVPFGPMF
jgi:hypothetical protein